MDILDVLKKDHRKAEKIFSEIEKIEDADKLSQYFDKLYKELSLHAQAEELTLYPAMREHEQTAALLEEAEEEHVEAKIMLEEIKSLDPSSPDFKAKIKQLKEAVLHHVEEEESEMFEAVSESMSEEEKEQLADEFKTTKEKLKPDVSKAANR